MSAEMQDEQAEILAVLKIVAAELPHMGHRQCCRCGAYGGLRA